MITRIKIGADPEMFAVIGKDGKLFSVPPYFFRKFLGLPVTYQKSDKEKKHPVFLKGSGWFWHEDGRAFELGIEPSYDVKELFDKIQEARATFSEKILSQFPEHCFPELMPHPTVDWDVERWESMPEDFYLCTQFGCDQDLDAFNMEASGQVLDASKHPEAYGGGHIHWSGFPMLREDPILTIKCLAFTAGCAATAYSDVPHLERRRVSVYGVPGRFRPQDYSNGERGIEYRTISNRWTNSWDIAKKIFEWGEIGLVNLLQGGLGKEISGVLEEPATKAILECDQNLAKQVLGYIQERI